MSALVGDQKPKVKNYFFFFGIGDQQTMVVKVSKQNICEISHKELCDSSITI